MDIKDSVLEKWLRARNMTTNKFIELVGCSRPVIWKVKRGLPISSKIANKVIQVTDGEVVPMIENVGRKKL